VLTLFTEKDRLLSRLHDLTKCWNNPSYLIKPCFFRINLNIILPLVILVQISHFPSLGHFILRCEEYKQAICHVISSILVSLVSKYLYINQPFVFRFIQSIFSTQMTNPKFTFTTTCNVVISFSIFYLFLLNGKNGSFFGPDFSKPVNSKAMPVTA
jgi:hypothetical protein